MAWLSGSVGSPEGATNPKKPGCDIRRQYRSVTDRTSATASASGDSACGISAATSVDNSSARVDMAMGDWVRSAMIGAMIEKDAIKKEADD